MRYCSCMSACLACLLSTCLLSRLLSVASAKFFVYRASTHKGTDRSLLEEILEEFFLFDLGRLPRPSQSVELDRAIVSYVELLIHRKRFTGHRDLTGRK